MGARSRENQKRVWGKNTKDYDESTDLSTKSDVDAALASLSGDLSSTLGGGGAVALVGVGQDYANIPSAFADGYSIISLTSDISQDSNLNTPIGGATIFSPNNSTIEFTNGASIYASGSLFIKGGVYIFDDPDSTVLDSPFKATYNRICLESCSIILQNSTASRSLIRNNGATFVGRDVILVNENPENVNLDELFLSTAINYNFVSQEDLSHTHIVDNLFASGYISFQSCDRISSPTVLISDDTYEYDLGHVPSNVSPTFGEINDIRIIFDKFKESSYHNSIRLGRRNAVGLSVMNPSNFGSPEISGVTFRIGNGNYSNFDFYPQILESDSIPRLSVQASRTRCSNFVVGFFTDDDEPSQKSRCSYSNFEMFNSTDASIYRECNVVARHSDSRFSNFNIPSGNFLVGALCSGNSLESISVGKEMVVSGDYNSVSSCKVNSDLTVYGDNNIFSNIIVYGAISFEAGTTGNLLLNSRYGALTDSGDNYKANNIPL